jgi:glycine/D-amino acid oxidase-like deaminating enzyme
MGSRCLWLFYKTPKYESEPETFDGKLFYMHQNAVTGNIFCGGDKRRLDEIFTSDDGTMSTIAKDNLSSFIAKRFEPPWGGPNAEDAEMLHRWSGIIGLTPDGFPFVGKALQGVSGRMGNGEWIAAGYNGYGMSQSWSCGEAIARMALGEPLPPWFPSVCLMNEERLGDEDRMGSEAFLSRLFDTNPEFVKR